MSGEALGVVVLLVATIVCLVGGRIRTEIVGIGIIVLLALTGILTPSEALSGFSSPATLTVAAMLVLSAGLERAGVVDYVSRHLARRGSANPLRLLWILALPTAMFSAFMNNTPVVALMIPVALSLAKRFSMPASKLLIPISYISILGGTCTLVGTSTNILVDSLYRAAGGPGFGVFEFSGLGLIYFAAGFVFLMLFSQRLLAPRPALSELLSASAPGHFVTELIVRSPSRLIDRKLGEALDLSEDLTVLELVRDEEAHLRPDPDIVLQDGDVLLIESDARSIHSLLSSKGVERASAVADDQRVLISRVDLRLAEAVVTPNSRFTGSKVRHLGLSRKHGVQVLGIRRLGRHHQNQLRDWRLRSGDVLLVQGETDSLRLLQEEGNVLLVEGVDRELTFPRTAPVAIAILSVVVLLAAFGVAPIVFLALAGVAAMFATRVLDVHHALRAVDPAVLMLLAGTIPLGRAMETTGLAEAVALWTIGWAGDHGPYVLIGAFYLLTSLLTEMVSNNATAVLLTPIALGVAAYLEVDPKALLIAVAFGGSASFATPVGYQTNTLVMGPGGYVFRDYLKIGLPMNLIMAVVATIFIPRIWPF